MDENIIANLNYIFDNMEDAVCVTNKLGIVQYMNLSAKKLFDIREENFGKKIWEFIPFNERNDDFVTLFIDTLTEKKAKNLTVDYENNDGKLFKLLVSMTYNDKNNGMFIILISDLTEIIRVHSAFSRYTSKEIAEYVLETPDGEKQGGKLKEVTILMSDLRGFTALSTKLSAEELIAVLNNYFEKMVAIIESYEGTVIEFLGDGMFVIFGAPKDNPRHAYNAVACAVEMENAMKKVNEWNKLAGFPQLEMGIGINSGKVVVGNIGSNQKMKYGCMGESVNLAGRIETFTTGGQIYISQYTRAMIDEELVIVTEQSILPKGAKDHIKIFEIEGVGNINQTEHKKQAIQWSEKIFNAEIQFFELVGKNVSEKSYEGKIIKLSTDEQYALLQTVKQLENFQNLMIDIGQNLYAKVIQKNADDYIICFTAKPDCFDTWIKSQ